MCIRESCIFVKKQKKKKIFPTLHRGVCIGGGWGGSLLILTECSQELNQDVCTLLNLNINVESIAAAQSLTWCCI